MRRTWALKEIRVLLRIEDVAPSSPQAIHVHYLLAGKPGRQLAGQTPAGHCAIVVSTAPPPQATVTADWRRNIMHPMFVALFIETDTGESLIEEQDKRRHARHARRSRAAQVSSRRLGARVIKPLIRR